MSTASWHFVIGKSKNSDGLTVVSSGLRSAVPFKLSVG
jgi:hypothetical protein